MDNYKENIRYLIPRPKSPPRKPFTFHSIYLDSIKRDYMLKKDGHRTMGYAEVPLNPPSQFLKKNTRKMTRPLVARRRDVATHDNDKPPKIKCLNKPPVKNVATTLKTSPVKKCSDKPKNIIKMNIIDVIRKVPPLPKHRMQDTRNGHVIVLNEAGLEPTYVSKKYFGKIPPYLVKILKQNEKAKQIEEERKRAIKPPMHLLTDDEVNTFLKGLKTNYKEMQEELTRMPLVVDILPKIERKRNMDKELAILDKYIVLLETNPKIYVCQDALNSTSCPLS